MTTRETERLYSAWLRSYKVPRHLDARSKALRNNSRLMIMASDLKDRPDFGWHVATTCFMRGCTFRLLTKPAYRWIAEAARLCVIQSGGGDPAEGDRAMLSAITAAHEIHLNATPARLLLHATMLAEDATAAKVALALGLDPLVVEAYDAVFYNVLERKDRWTYLRQAVKFGVTRERGMEPPHNPEEEGVLLRAALNGRVYDVMRLVRCDAYVGAPRRSSLLCATCQ
jgi:hypothetical protein